MRWSVWRGALVALVALVMASALAWGAWSAPGVAPVRAAGGCSPCIHWSPDMIYPGRNNGYPEGPVGEHVSVNGDGFNVYAGATIRLVLVKGDVNNALDAQFCQSATPRVAVTSGIPVDSSGNISATFDWPAAASSGEWSVCAMGPDGPPTFNKDDGPFYVMSSHKPSLTLSRTTVAPGGSVTVTGRNWLPGQGQIFVYAGPCADCGAAPLASAMVSSNGSGFFAVTLTFPESVIPGQYLVSAHNQSGVLDMLTSGPHITVALAPTATPNPTTTAAPTTTTASGNGAGNGNSNGNEAGSSDASTTFGLPGWLLALLGGLGGLALAALVAGIVILTRRRPPAPPSGPTSYWRGPGPGATPPITPYPSYSPAGPDEPTRVDLPPQGRAGG
jgi:hypothetical protein